MKKRLLKFILPIGLGLVLSIITIWGLVGCEPVNPCADGQLEGDNGHCYSCSAGASPTYAPSGNCSAAVSGVYCCAGGGGGGGSTGCQPKTGCPLSASWKGGDGYCYATSTACHTGRTSDYRDDNSTCRQCN